jgi:GT2 family glycosyltransferase/glycosyltransferase involved in cell wall biosynthesis
VAARQSTGRAGARAARGETDRAAALHRYRFVLPLCRGRHVADLGPADAEGAALLADAGARLLPADGAEPAEVVLSLAPLRAQALTGTLAALRRRLAPGGIVVAAVTDAAAVDAAPFRHALLFDQVALAGSFIVERAARDVGLAPLADAPGAPLAVLLVTSDADLPPVASALFAGTVAPPATPPRGPPPLAEPEPSDLHRRAVSLVDRLVEVETRAVAGAAAQAGLRAEVERLRASGGSGATAFDVPRTAHPWPLLDAPDRDPSSLGSYEHRPDDALVAEARAGEAFLRRFALLTDAPDLDGAVAALNDLPRALPLDDAPDVSIVVPVYGQIGYTLNCLHSLFGQASKARADIIVADDASPDATARVLPRIAGLRVLSQRDNRGFLRTCNAAARGARGRVLVLLNNDTRLLPGWLDALLDGFARWPRAGLIGSKLLYPDGSLQEAGAIIWRDGSAWNYGRNDDPNRPHYCHARRVDYVSGASIAVPLDLWRGVGGFDEHYAPAYSEESDLALRLQAAGHEVWYEPFSRAIHYEGRTSGTDTASGAKAHQVANAAKLYMRWRETLVVHRPNGEAPYFERERSAHKRALVVDATTPTPKQDAGSVTTTLTLGLFQALGYKTHFAPQDNFLYEPAHTPALQAFGVECAYAPFDTEFDEYIRRYGALFDVVLVYRVGVLAQVLEALRRHAPKAAVLFHAMDLHFLRMERQADLGEGGVTHADAARMKATELDLIRRVDCTITHSTYERDLLAREAPGAPVVVWPFMFEFFGTSVDFMPRRDYVFLGGYRHQPNVDAVRFFAREVMPLILAEQPDARFVIAGANPGPEVLDLAGPHVVVTGMIDDLRDAFDAARVFVCPLRVGAGVKGKISTAMSYGLPVVSTTCGAEGMDLVEGEEVLIADTPADLAAACLRVHRSATLWRRLSEAGQRLVREKHSLDMGRRVLAEAIEVALRHKLGLDA